MKKEYRAPNGREADFLQSRNHFADIPEDESKLDIFIWNTSGGVGPRNSHFSSQECVFCRDRHYSGFQKPIVRE